MKTRIICAIATAALALACVVALPKLVRADGLSIHDRNGSVSVDLHAGDDHHRRDHDHDRHIRHEEMDAALGALRDARNHLDKGGHEFGGHRARAIRATDNAIREIQASIDYANSHDH